MRRGAAFAALLVLAPTATALAQGESDQVLDARIRASAAAAQGLQGPLDGGWTLVGADGKLIFAFQIVDRPGGDGLEGVWRDLRRPVRPGDIGLIDGLQRAGTVLTINLTAKAGDPPTMISLTQGADGTWKGELREAGAVTQVTLRRN